MPDYLFDKVFVYYASVNYCGQLHDYIGLNEIYVIYYMNIHVVNNTWSCLKQGYKNILKFTILI